MNGWRSYRLGDVEREEEIWMTSGPLFDAIRASIAIPMVLTPHDYRGRVLFDGGLLNPLPIAPAFAVPGAWRVAVNVNGHPDPRWERRVGRCGRLLGGFPAN